MSVLATESPDTLQNLCLRYIARDIVPASSDISRDAVVLRNSFQIPNGTFIHSAIADLLILQMSACGTLCNESLQLFQSSTACLRNAVIRRSPVTAAGLRVLRSHKLVTLVVEPNDPKQLTIADIMCCLNEWTVTNLRSLGVSGVTFGQSGGPPVIVSLCALRNLHSLDVSRTDFTDNMLKIIVDDLPLLESLDISSTLVKDVTSLSQCRTRLRQLLMCNIRLQDSASVDVLRTLSALRVLDMSHDPSSTSFSSFKMNAVTAESILLEGSEFHDLISLDISCMSNVHVGLVRKFIESHKQLEFMGLFMTEIATSDLFDKSSAIDRPNFSVTEEKTEAGLLRSLCRYSARPPFVHCCLHELFRNKIPEYSQARPDIVKLIIAAMRQHLYERGILIAATACLYHLIRSELSKMMPSGLLTSMVELLLDAVEIVPNQQQLVKNSVLILCNDHILQEVDFDRYRCCQLVLDCLCRYEDPPMVQMSIAICGILAAKIPTSQTSCLGGNRPYMQKLLSIIDSRIDSQVIDTTLKYTLSALWNLSDEAPLTCEMFVEEGGMQIFMRILETFKSEDLEVKLLGFLNNLAEVKHLKNLLAEEEVLLKIRELLRSSQLDVSYFAGGIIAHLLADVSSHHMIPAAVAAELCHELEEAVLQWQQPEQEMVAYRSFSPFFPLLSETADSAVHLWALWAWQHVCNLNGDRYCSLLVDEGGVDIIHQILSSPTTHPLAVDIASDVLRMVAAKFPESVVGV